MASGLGVPHHGGAMAAPAVPAVSSIADTRAASSPRNVVRRGDKAHHLLGRGAPPASPALIDIRPSMGRALPGVKQIARGSVVQVGDEPPGELLARRKTRTARAKIFSPCTLSRRWTTLASEEEGVRLRRPACWSAGHQLRRCSGRAAGDRRARSPWFARLRGRRRASLIPGGAGTTRRDPQSRATTSV